MLAASNRDDVGDAAFPFARSREIAVAGALVLTLCISYVRELRLELHAPVEFALTVYDTPMSAGVAHGIVNAGYRTIESLRLEMGYRAWATDIGPDHSLLMAGLAFACKLDKAIPCHDRHALLAQQAQPLSRLLAGFTVDAPDRSCSAARPSTATVRADWLTSTGFGCTIGKSVGYGYVRAPTGIEADYVLSGSYELEG